MVVFWSFLHTRNRFGTTKNGGLFLQWKSVKSSQDFVVMMCYRLMMCAKKKYLIFADKGSTVLALKN